MRQKSQATAPARTSDEAAALVRRRFDPGQRSVLITGASGYLGRNLLDRLLMDRRYARLLCTGVVPPPQCRRGSAGALFSRVDLTHPDAAPQLARLISEHEVDSVVHLAFTSKPTHNLGWAHELEVIGTMRVLDACTAARPRKLLCWGQSIGYGAFPDNPYCIDERQPLRGWADAPFVADKVEAERLIAAYARDNPSTSTTVLRTAPLLQQGCHSYLADYLQLPAVPTLAGYDPLIQLLAGDDAVDAFKVALDADFAGVYNIAATGVLPLHTIIALTGKLAFPLPAAAARSLLQVARLSQISAWPSSLVDLLRYSCVIETKRSSREMGFRARHSVVDVVRNFADTRAQRPSRRTAGVALEPTSKDEIAVRR